MTCWGRQLMMHCMGSVSLGEWCDGGQGSQTAARNGGQCRLWQRLADGASSAAGGAMVLLVDDSRRRQGRVDVDELINGRDQADGDADVFEDETDEFEEKRRLDEA
ncbi:hypothetical protein ACLOJK_038617 [Asimina triloba]